MSGKWPGTRTIPGTLKVPTRNVFSEISLLDFESRLGKNMGPHFSKCSHTLTKMSSLPGMWPVLHLLTKFVKSVKHQVGLLQWQTSGACPPGSSERPRSDQSPVPEAWVTFGLLHLIILLLCPRYCEYGMRLTLWVGLWQNSRRLKARFLVEGLPPRAPHVRITALHSQDDFFPVLCVKGEHSLGYCFGLWNFRNCLWRQVQWVHWLCYFSLAF